MLAMKYVESDQLVVSPYSSFLVLQVDPAAAVRNLRRMEARGWTGRYGFYESVDFSGGQEEVIRTWMAHHVGMSMLAACNVLYGDPFRQYFQAEPHVLATDLLLHERVPRTIVPDEKADPGTQFSPVPAS
jgi:hypothetical protein